MELAEDPHFEFEGDFQLSELGVDFVVLEHDIGVLEIAESQFGDVFEVEGGGVCVGVLFEEISDAGGFDWFC